MTDAEKVYEEWLSDPYFDEDTKRELRDIAGDEKSQTDFTEVSHSVQAVCAA